MFFLNRKEKGGGALPNLIVIGAPKSGTTSLHENLKLHPQIAMSREKELRFFMEEFNWKRGVDWYRSRFSREAEVRGESSVGYSLYPIYQNVPERIHHVVPKARLIYLVRDPIDRMVSHYVHLLAEGREDRPIEAAIMERGMNRYLAASLYGMQIGRYLPFFPLSRFLILALEDLQRDPARVMQRAFEFLGVDPAYTSPRFGRVRHRSERKRRKNRAGMMLKSLAESRAAECFTSQFRRAVGRMLYPPVSRPIPRPVLSNALKGRIAERLQDDLKTFRTLTGRRFRSWQV